MPSGTSRVSKRALGHVARRPRCHGASTKASRTSPSPGTATRLDGHQRRFAHAFVLDDPDGNSWVMKSAGLIVDPTQTYESLEGPWCPSPAGGRLVVPHGGVGPGPDPDSRQRQGPDRPGQARQHLRPCRRRLQQLHTLTRQPTAHSCDEITENGTERMTSSPLHVKGTRRLRAGGDLPAHRGGRGSRTRSSTTPPGSGRAPTDEFEAIDTRAAREGDGL